ncbi:sensor histidine kinase [Kineococcus terrestris]|uniref:sensor histidine kinase n=1 Tax=Kineococcus terrestris TaxID=2044856 RepID=UPI0034DACA8E
MHQQPVVRAGRRWPPWWWTLPYALLVLTALLTAPRTLAAHRRLGELDLPDERWSTAQLRAALADLGVPEPAYAVAVALSAQVVAVVFLAVAGLVGRRRPGDRGALVVSLLLAAAGWGTAGVPVVWEEVWPAAAPALRATSVAAFGCLGLLLFVVPDGRFRPRWTAWVALAGLAVPVLSVPGLLRPSGEVLPPPARWVMDVAVVAVPLWAQVRRFRRSGPVVRRQLAWVLWSLGVLAVGWALLSAVTALAPGLSAPGTGGLLFVTAVNVLLALLVTTVPVAVGVAVLRHRLWDVEPLVGRTLVGAALTVATAGTYLVVAAAVNGALRSQDDVAGAVVAAAVVAVLFEPARRRVQRAVNRVCFGDRDVPHLVTARALRAVEAAATPEDVLRAVAVALRTALRCPWVAVELTGPDGRAAAAARDPAPDAAPGAPAAREVDLTDRGEQVGRVLLAARAPGEGFGPRDLRLLDEVARHVAPALHAVRSAGELQHARARLVASSQEERRRLRRELHDGVGPALASVALDLEVAGEVLRTDAAAGGELLEGARERVRETVAAVRGLAYGLYPPALERSGLLGAVRELAEEHLARTGTRVELDLPGELPPLPAAVEVAAHRVAAEAVLNVARHAGARTCRVRLALVPAAGAPVLEVEVRDDGGGPGGARPGVGRLAMAERAEELGGTCAVEPAAGGGTRVLARLPVREQP